MQCQRKKLGSSCASLPVCCEVAVRWVGVWFRHEFATFELATAKFWLQPKKIDFSCFWKAVCCEVGVLWIGQNRISRPKKQTGYYFLFISGGRIRKGLCWTSPYLRQNALNFELPKTKFQGAQKNICSSSASWLIVARWSSLNLHMFPPQFCICFVGLPEISSLTGEN